MRDAFRIVVHTLVWDDNAHLLLLRRANTGFMDGRYTLPGGHRRGGETASAAAMRECHEEAGIEIEPQQLRPIAALPYRDGVNIVFEAIAWTGSAVIGEPSKCDDLVFAIPHQLSRLPAPVAPFIPHALDCRSSGTWFREFE